MKLFYLIIFFFAFACNYSNKTKETSKDKICTTDYDSVLDKYSQSFEPSTIDLSKSLSPTLNLFLLNVDTNCLRKEKKYEVFITIILAKLNYYHLKCCNQGYDLQSMEQGGAKVIINEFKNIAGYKSQRLEMLNSSTVVDFIEHHQALKDNTTLKDILKKIDEEASRIDKGNL